MKTFLLSLVAALICSTSAKAIPISHTYSFNPNPADLYDLDHYKVYTWGIDWRVPEGEQIIGATIRFTDIWDWIVEPDDILHVQLLDRAKDGVTVIKDDNQNPSDYFQSSAYNNKGINHTFIGSWTDPVGGTPSTFDLVFNFNAAQLAALRTYINSVPSNPNQSNFGLGFDPDCHYWNNGISFEIRTNNVPEGGTTALLLGLSVASCAALRRKFA